MRPAEQLAAERARGNLQLAEQLRCARRVRTLRRAGGWSSGPNAG
jgi:hypothetical protein